MKLFATSRTSLSEKTFFQITVSWRRGLDWTWTGAVSSRKAPRSSGTTTAVRRHDAVNKSSRVSSTTIATIDTPLRWRSVRTSSSRPWKAGGAATGARNGKSRKMAGYHMAGSSPITRPITRPSTAKARRQRRVQPGTVSIIRVRILSLVSSSKVAENNLTYSFIRLYNLIRGKIEVRKGGKSDDERMDDWLILKTISCNSFTRLAISFRVNLKD